MDQKYLKNDICFIWDEQKAKTNKNKHGLSFEQATEAFFDPFLRVVDASQNNEQRDAVIGTDQSWNILFVVHIQVEGDEIRIISARRATKKEVNDYEN